MRSAAPARRRSWLPLLATGAALLLWPTAAQSLPRIEPGIPLQRALRMLQREGVRVVFSSALVPPSLRVVATPSDGTPEHVLRELLAPHGLDIEPALGRRWLVVRRATTAAAPEGSRAYVAAESITVESSTPRLTDARTGARTFAQESMPQLTASTALADALGMLPGTTGADVMAPAYARGAGSGEMEVLLDGVDVEAAPRLRGLQSLLGIVDSQSIERMDLLAGGYPARFEGSLGGILNLVPTTRLEPRTEVGVGSLGERLLSSGRLGERDGWLLAARNGRLRDGIDTHATVYEGLRPRYLDVFARLSRDVGAGGTLNANAYYAGDREWLAATTQQTIGQNDDRANAWLSFDAPWTARLSGRTRMVYGRGQADLEVLTARGSEGPLLHRQRHTGFTRAELAQDWSYRAARIAPSAALLVRAETAAAAEAATPAGEGGPALLPPLGNRGVALEAYLTDLLDLGAGRSLEAGLRVQRQSWAGTTVTPRLNLVWPLAGGALSLGAGRFAQSQRLYQTRLEAGLRQPQPPEIADQLALAYDRRWARTELQVAGYRTRASQLWPRLEPELGAPLPLAGGSAAGVVVQPTAAHLEGVELLASARLASTLDGLLSYTWSRATERLAGEDVRRDWDQRHALDGYLAWRPYPLVAFRLRGLYGSGWPYTPEVATAQLDEQQHTVVTVAAGPRNAGQLPPSWRLDLGATLDVPLRLGSMELEVALLNLTDHDNVAAVGGFEYTALLGQPAESRRIDLLGLHRTASLGLTWRF